MARTINEIQQSIIDAKNADATLTGLNSNSRVAVWLLWTWVVATSQWVTENLFDAHKAEVNAILASQRPHTLQWYATKAKLFQFGDTLPQYSDVYDVIDATKQIVAFAAAVELPSLVRIKVAKVNGSVLQPLATPELTAFVAYMQRIKDAGVRLQLTSDNGDSLRLALNVFYDPLILDAAGKRLDGSNDTPVQSAINTFIDTLPFNGVFVLNYLIAAIQAVEGVIIGEVVYCAANYGTLPYLPVTSSYVPDAGYLVVDAAYFTTNTIYTGYGVI